MNENKSRNKNAELLGKGIGDLFDHTFCQLHPKNLEKVDWNVNVILISKANVIFALRSRSPRMKRPFFWRGTLAKHRTEPT